MSLDLIIWRHAEADDEREGLDDLQRALPERAGAAFDLGVAGSSVVDVMPSGRRMCSRT